MQPIMVLGSIVFELRHNLEGAEFEGETDFATHKVLGGSPLYEHMTLGESERVIKGTTFPMDPDYAPAFGVVKALESMRVSGQPQHLMRGDGESLGWCLVTKVKEEGSYLAPNGVPHRSNFSVTLQTCDAPPVSGFASIIADFFL
ncbi:phage tail protein [Bosea sp. (in: a-proteobacteria)]|uniref:phage tail protein n=1 Tax=Bosea sp. (in: a-proteobacteria) TaxID=1871050 RepID=UPI001AC320CF|nr:phage tail protein [Bosea sp. (in: a-proteobacteria)]MBN9444392.1 phage tail protein [Bosea sp. (in: a-proteobacteria)]